MPIFLGRKITIVTLLALLLFHEFLVFTVLSSFSALRRLDTRGSTKFSGACLRHLYWCCIQTPNTLHLDVELLLNHKSTWNSMETISDPDRSIVLDRRLLNDDVLILLLHHLSNKNLLAVMCTCNHFLRLGLPILLARKITLSTFTALLSFHRFLVFAGPSSFPALRCLDIQPWHLSDVSQDCLEAVADILRGASGLRTLSIITKLIDWDVTIEAIISLTSLRELKLRGEPCAGQPRAMLSLIRCPLTKLCLDRTTYSDRAAEFWKTFSDEGIDTNPMPVIERFQGSLQEIDLSGVALSNPPDPFSCPKVTRVKMDSFTTTPLALVATLFPATQVLIASTDRYGKDVEEDPEISVLRDGNIVFQRESPCWQSLVAIQAPWHSLYVMALQCEVVSVDITPYFMDIRTDSSFDAFGLQRLLCHFRPQHLRITLDGIPFNMASLLSGGISRLQRLDINVTVWYEPDESRTPLDEDLVSALKGLQIRMLECQLDISSKADDRVLRLTDQDRRVLDLSTLARSALEAIPSLEYIRLVVGSSEYQLPNEQSYWEISKAGDQSILTQISQDDSSAIDAIDKMFIPAEIRDEYREPFLWVY